MKALKILPVAVLILAGMPFDSAEAQRVTSRGPGYSGGGRTGASLGSIRSSAGSRVSSMAAVGSSGARAGNFGGGASINTTLGGGRTFGASTRGANTASTQAVNVSVAGNGVGVVNTVSSGNFGNSGRGWNGRGGSHGGDRRGDHRGGNWHHGGRPREAFVPVSGNFYGVPGFPNNYGFTGVPHSNFAGSGFPGPFGPGYTPLGYAGYGLPTSGIGYKPGYGGYVYGGTLNANFNPYYNGAYYGYNPYSYSGVIGVPFQGGRKHHGGWGGKGWGHHGGKRVMRANAVR